MAQKDWFIHIHGNVIGPLTNDLVVKMLEERRVDLADFIWREGLGKWHRMNELDEFMGYQPPYPRVSIPSGGGGASKRAPEVEPEEAPAPVKAKAAPAPAPAPAKAKPKPEPEPKREPTPAEVAATKYQSAARVLAQGRAEIESIGELDIVNISESGLFVKSETPPPMGEEVKMVVSLEGVDRPLEMTGVVIRHGEAEKNPGFAVEFTRLNPSHRRLISEYVKGRQ